MHSRAIGSATSRGCASTIGLRGWSAPPTISVIIAWLEMAMPSLKGYTSPSAARAYVSRCARGSPPHAIAIGSPIVAVSAARTASCAGRRQEKSWPSRTPSETVLQRIEMSARARNSRPAGARTTAKSAQPSTSTFTTVDRIPPTLSPYTALDGERVSSYGGGGSGSSSCVGLSVCAGLAARRAGLGKALALAISAKLPVRSPKL
mmetsp:Transcript_12459/g.31548  ORF Transcript_12459/g.31548 Transcript_12459/m.31548 type:complete len:205 (-) Transcript_12459:66-680(-)